MGSQGSECDQSGLAQKIPVFLRQLGFSSLDYRIFKFCQELCERLNNAMSPAFFWVSDMIRKTKEKRIALNYIL